MSRLKIQSEGSAPMRAPENDHLYRSKRDRSVFDRMIILIAYLFAPLGFVLAMLRFVSTHYKNERKSINFKLLYHVCMGAFMELALLFAVGTYKGDFTWITLVIVLVVLYVIFVVPARSFSWRSNNAKMRFEFLCSSYLRLITAEEVRHIGNIADKVRESEADVRRDLKYLTDWGLLAADIVYYEGRVRPYSQQPPNQAHSDRAQFSGASQLQQSSRRQSAEKQLLPNTSADNSPTQLPKSMSCSGCGAKSRVLPGKDKICDYCGTTIPYS